MEKKRKIEVKKNLIFITITEYYINSKQNKYSFIYKMRSMKCKYLFIKFKVKSFNNDNRLILT